MKTKVRVILFEIETFPIIRKSCTSRNPLQVSNFVLLLTYTYQVPGHQNWPLLRDGKGRHVAWNRPRSVFSLRILCTFSDMKTRYTRVEKGKFIKFFCDLRYLHERVSSWDFLVLQPTFLICPTFERVPILLDSDWSSVNLRPLQEDLKRISMQATLVEHLRDEGV